MKVKMIKSHPYGGRLVEGQEIVTSIKQAEELIKGGFAEEVKPKAKRTRKPKSEEIMVVIGLGKEGIEKGKKYNVGHQIAAVLISHGLAYKEGEEPPKKTRKKQIESE